MVDFQSRDTRRGPTNDDEPADGASESAEAEDGDTADEAVPADEHGDTADEAVPEDKHGDTADEAVPEDEHGDTVAETAGADAPAAEGADASDPDTAADDPPDAAERTPSGPATPTSAVPETQPTPSRSLDVAVVTIGTETPEPLEERLTTAFESADHRVAAHERLRGGYDAVQGMVESLVGREAVDAVVTVGGVGLAADELAIEAVHPLLEKALPGFGEAFRSLLFDRIGTGIVGVRSTAGVADGTLVFCLPADVEAATLAVEEILAVEAPELVARLE